MDGIALQLQKEKEENIQEGQQKILEEVELQLEVVHVKYDGIISKARENKDQPQRLDHIIVSVKRDGHMSVYNRGKLSKVEPY